MADALSDSAPVHLQLGLSGTPGADTSPKPRQVRPLTRQPGQKIFELGQLHLNFSFVAASPLSENIKNQLTTVNDPYFKSRLQVALLCRSQILVHDDKIGMEFLHRRLNLL